MNQLLTGQFIKTCRKEKGFTQEQLAEKLNVSPKTVSKWECGNGLPEVGLMLPLCEQLGITVNELLSGCRIAAENYQTKAEENLLAALREKRENKTKFAMQCIVAFIAIFGGCLLVLIAGLLPMQLWLRILLIGAAVLIVVLGITVCCVLDRDGGYFECPHCKALFVPTIGAYVMGAHSLTRRRLKCPQCGKVGFCKKKFHK